jgi:hypothetical protein
MGFTLVVDWDALEALKPELAMVEHFLGGGGNAAFSSYWETAEVVATHGLELYQGFCKGVPLPSGRKVQHPSGSLSRATRLERTATDWVLHNDSPYASFVEEGTKAYDMKQALQKSEKARRAKDGSLYLIIPFRHGTPGAVGLRPMPARIHALARVMQKSSITGRRMEPNAFGRPVARNTYAWGDRLSPKKITEAGGSSFDARRFGGMVRFGNPKGGHGSYMTFRVMSSKSSGWVRPAIPGLFPLKTAIEESTREGQEFLQAAFMEDLGRLLAGD